MILYNVHTKNNNRNVLFFIMKEHEYECVCLDPIRICNTAAVLLVVLGSNLKVQCEQIIVFLLSLSYLQREWVLHVALPCSHSSPQGTNQTLAQRGPFLFIAATLGATRCH